jgi:hypothetical protein
LSLLALPRDNNAETTNHCTSLLIVKKPKSAKFEKMEGSCPKYSKGLLMQKCFN